MIYIYQDKGVSLTSCRAIKKALMTLNSTFNVCFLNASEVREKSWRKTSKLLIIPGGADVFYLSQLQKQGIEAIRFYVEEGGCYLGLCAGGYFGASVIEFSKNTSLEIKEKRDLNFFKGIARGPFLSPYVYGSHKGAAIAFLESKEFKGKIFPAYYNGGCYFVDAENKKHTKVLYTYREESTAKKKAAIILCCPKEGKAILSGVHPEYTAEIIQTLIKRKEKGYQVLQGMKTPLTNSSPLLIWERILRHFEIFL